MKNIIFKTNHLEYIISQSGENLSFTFDNGKNVAKKAPCSYITNSDRKKIFVCGATFAGDILTLTYEDSTIAKILVHQMEEYITFTLKSITREDFLSISFVNIELNDTGEWCGCLLGMTLATHMKEHPGQNTYLTASAYPHIGLFKTKRSKLPAKAAIIGCKKENLRAIQKEVLSAVPNGELPFNSLGGPYADMAVGAQEAYALFISTTVTEENVYDIIDSLKKFSIDQVILHHYSHYIQGDFSFYPDKVPGGLKQFRKVVDIFHKEGIKVGIQTYSFFLVHQSSYVSPIPHKDLDIIRFFTLKENLKEKDTCIRVEESTEGITVQEGYIYINSPYLWIDDELIKFKSVGNGEFYEIERGALGTKISAHSKGSVVKQLKQYYLIPVAKAGSELFYEIARNTAKFYNDSGADFFYLDALDGAFVLEGEDYVWYHAVDFIKELFDHINRGVIFDCCYNPAYTGSWFVRSRYGAIDVSLNAHRRCVDAHLIYNDDTAVKMGLTPELGWIDMYPGFFKQGFEWQSDLFLPEDMEFLCSKAYASQASIAFLESFHKMKTTPRSNAYAEILKKYALLRKTTSPSKEAVEYIKKEENSAILENGKLVKARYSVAVLEQCNDKICLYNPFEQQQISFKMQPLSSAGDYESSKGVTLLKIDSKKPVKTQHVRFETPVNSNGNTGLGVWCYGDKSGTIICISLRDFSLNSQRESQHFIKVDFSGWKYFRFREHQNETLPLDEWERKELVYETYNELQKFYHHYRVNLNYNAIDGVDIIVKGDGEVYLRDLKLVPHDEFAWINPCFTSSGSTLKIHGNIYADQLLSFDGNKCTVYDNLGNVIATPKHSGMLLLETGDNDITVTHDGNKAARCKLTATFKGDIIPC